MRRQFWIPRRLLGAAFAVASFVIGLEVSSPPRPLRSSGPAPTVNRTLKSDRMPVLPAKSRNAVNGPLEMQGPAGAGQARRCWTGASPLSAPSVSRRSRRSPGAAFPDGPHLRGSLPGQRLARDPLSDTPADSSGRVRRETCAARLHHHIPGLRTASSRMGRRLHDCGRRCRRPRRALSNPLLAQPLQQRRPRPKLAHCETEWNHAQWMRTCLIARAKWQRGPRW